MSTASGQLTNAVFGFTSMFIYVLKDQRPDGVLVAFDRPEPTFRHEADADYKANRDAAPDPCASRWGSCARCSTPSAWPRSSSPGARPTTSSPPPPSRPSAAGDDVVIVTGDRDAYQLVARPARQGALQPARRERLRPLRRGRASSSAPASRRPSTREYAALRGDPSDNLPGVPGVGEKTAAKLINTYGGLDGIFGHLDEQTPKLRASLAEHEAARPQEPRGDDPAPRRADRDPRRPRRQARPRRGQAAVRLPRVPHVRGAAGRGARPGRPSPLAAADEREQLVAEVTVSDVAGGVGRGARRRSAAARPRRGVRRRAGPQRRRRPRRRHRRRRRPRCCGSRPTTSPTRRVAGAAAAQPGCAATTPSR